MMMNNTLAQLRDLKLAGMASAVEEQLSSAASTGLSFEERLALMVDREVHHRGDKRRAALLKKAGLKYPQACIEDVDSKPERGFECSSLMSLALSRWAEDGTAILGQQTSAMEMLKHPQNHPFLQSIPRNFAPAAQIGHVRRNTK